MTREDAYALGNIIHQEVITFYESQFNEIFKKCNIYPQYRSFRGNTNIRSKLINQIFNDHEARVQAKDDEIRRLNNLYADTIKDLGEVLIEIERLKDQLSSVHNIMYRNGYSDAIDCYDTFGNFNTRHKPNAKARSIVAMLFWVFAKNRRLHKTNKYFSQDAVTESYFCFQQAYKMLKVQQ